jgi:type IV secretion system protein VirB3
MGAAHRIHLGSLVARTVDTLFVACTRPSMRWGVPYEGFLANGLITTVVVMLFIQSPPGYLLGIGVHLVMRELCRTNPHFFFKWKLWGKTKARSTSGPIWGGSRLQPTFSRTKKAAHMPISV